MGAWTRRKENKQARAQTPLGAQTETCPTVRQAAMRSPPENVTRLPRMALTCLSASSAQPRVTTAVPRFSNEVLPRVTSGGSDAAANAKFALSQRRGIHPRKHTSSSALLLSRRHHRAVSQSSVHQCLIVMRLCNPADRKTSSIAAERQNITSARRRPCAQSARCASALLQLRP